MTMKSLFFEREVNGQAIVITLTTECIDWQNAAQVTLSINEAIAGGPRAVIDLGALRYFDVCGFAAILHWTAGGREATDVKLSSKSANVRALFELLRADTLVPLYASADEAMDSFPRLAMAAGAGQAAWGEDLPFAGKIAS